MSNGGAMALALGSVSASDGHDDADGLLGCANDGHEEVDLVEIEANGAALSARHPNGVPPPSGCAALRRALHSRAGDRRRDPE